MGNSPTRADARATGVQSIQRAIAILKAFSPRKNELGVTELSRELDLHKSTVSRLLTSLQREGLVEENPVTRKYRLGMALVTLGGLVLQGLEVTEAARPLMQELAGTSQETVVLAVKDRDEAINVAQIPSPRPVKHVERIGRRDPLHCTAVGKILLAHSTPAEQDAIVCRGLPRYTPFTITDPDDFRQELASVRERGYATGEEEYEIGLNSVAAPVYDHTREVVAAIGISGPAFRLYPEQFSTLSRHVRQIALKLSRQLGCTYN